MNRDELIEQCTSAHRQRIRGEIRPSEAWHDLHPADREAAFDATVLSRDLEAALDPDGLSATAHAVLARIRLG